VGHIFAETSQVELHIEDDGCGFDPDAVGEGHLGIQIMIERATTIGGNVQIHSKPDEGTEVIITWSNKVEGKA